MRNLRCKAGKRLSESHHLKRVCARVRVCACVRGCVCVSMCACSQWRRRVRTTGQPRYDVCAWDPPSVNFIQVSGSRLALLPPFRFLDDSDTQTGMRTRAELKMSVFLIANAVLLMA